jgi:hypothetical protein
MPASVVVEAKFLGLPGHLVQGRSPFGIATLPVVNQVPERDPTVRIDQPTGMTPASSSLTR